jgi:hypothetical protein
MLLPSSLSLYETGHMCISSAPFMKNAADFTLAEANPLANEKNDCMCSRPLRWRRDLHNKAWAISSEKLPFNEKGLLG